MSKLEDLSNQKFNKLTFIEFYGRINGETYWLCECDCGTIKKIQAAKVKSGHTKSCGCIQKYKDLTGLRFGKLTVKCMSHINDRRDRCWCCICDCGKEVMVTGGNLLTNNTKSCGCYNDECKRLRTGKNSPNWRHDLTDKQRKEDKDRSYNPKIRKWRKKVYVRDSYTCQCCGQVGGKLQAHHIYAYNKYEKLRYVVSNGVTLCIKCHKEFHKVHGKCNNTRKQFTAFRKFKLGNL